MRKPLIQLVAVVALALWAGPIDAFSTEPGQTGSSATAAETKPAADATASASEEKPAAAVSSQASSSSGKERSGSKRRNRSSSRQSAQPVAAEPASTPVEEPAAAAPAEAEVYPPSLDPAPAAQPSALVVPASTTAAQAPGVANVPAAAAPAVQEIPATASEFPVARMLGALGIVLSLIAAGVFGARKFAPQLFRKAGPEKNLKIVETLQLGEKRSISVIQIEDKRFLIGSTSSQITLLAPLRGPLSVEDGPAAKAPVEPAAAPRPKAPVEKFRNIFEIEKASPARNGGRTRTIPPDVRAKMRQLRESLEQ